MIRLHERSCAQEYKTAILTHPMLSNGVQKAYIDLCIRLQLLPKRQNSVEWASEKQHTNLDIDDLPCSIDGFHLLSEIMKFQSIVVSIATACVLMSCGGNPDTKQGEFAAISKKETDADFKLVAPSSKSPAAFTFSIDNPGVATISGDVITIVGPGKATITASQPELGSFGPSHGTTTLTVEAVPCATGQTRINKQCVAIPTCVPPAILTNNQCVAPQSNAAPATVQGLTWMPVAHVDTWANARAYCQTTTISGASGWRQPSDTELAALYASGEMNGKGWTLGHTWSSTMASNLSEAGHVALNLSTGASSERPDVSGSYVACVR